jgi:hypothetical protein
MRPWGAVLVLASGCGRIGFSVSTDGAPSDGAPSDGATPGDGVVPAAACPAFASFCDGFESGNLDAWSGSSVIAATQQVESSIVHTGHYALEAVAPTSTRFYAWAIHNFPSQTSGILAVREWLYAPQPLVAYDQVLTVYGGSANNDDYIDLNGSADNAWLASEGDGPTASVLANDASTTPIAQSTWVCVELDVMLATTGSALTVYVADQEVLTASLLTPSPGYNSVFAGLAAPPGNGVTAYVDDVVMAAQHIGCQ